MLYSVINYHRTGDMELWPVQIAYAALSLFAAGLLLTGLKALL